MKSNCLECFIIRYTYIFSIILYNYMLFLRIEIPDRVIVKNSVLFVHVKYVYIYSR